MDVLKVFRECAEQVNGEFQEADASERLRATVSLVGLRMRARWEDHQMERQAAMENSAASVSQSVASLFANAQRVIVPVPGFEGKLELCGHHHGEGETLPSGVAVASCQECHKIYAVDADVRALMKEESRASKQSS